MKLKVEIDFSIDEGMRPAVWESDADKQKQLFDAYNKETIQPHLKKIEEQLEANGSNYLVGSEVLDIN